MALSASGLIAGKNEVKYAPVLCPRPPGRKVNPRKVKLVCSWSPRRLPSLAIDDTGLVRVELEAHLLHPLGDSSEHLFGLRLVAQCTTASSA